MRKFNIQRPDHSLRTAIQDKIDNLNKSRGSLGVLEELAMQICLVQHTLSPALHRPHHLLLAGDHGITDEGVSVSPRAVTWQQMVNFTRDGGGVNMFCRQHGFELMLIDMGVDHDLTAYPAILNHKIARGTQNFIYGPAMTPAQFKQAIDTGASLVDDCRNKGCNILCIGEMGVGNTSPSSIWTSIFGDIPLAECIGAGAGLDGAGVCHKHDVLQRAMASAHCETAEEIIRHFGGFEMVGAIGAMLHAAELGILIIIDGFIMSACILAASKLYPQVLDYAVFGHCGDESGHRRLLQLMNAQPLLHLGLRLGEGTGALCAYPIIDSAVRMMNEMNNFKDAKIDKYF